MCVVIEINGEIIETGKELKALVGIDNIVFLHGVTEIDENECLCHIDIPATAHRAGFKCRRRDWPDFRLTKLGY